MSNKTKEGKTSSTISSKVRDEKGKTAYSVDELHAEANLLVVAGSDTNATATCVFWFYILRKGAC